MLTLVLPLALFEVNHEAVGPELPAAEVADWERDLLAALGTTSTGALPALSTACAAAAAAASTTAAATHVASAATAAVTSPALLPAFIAPTKVHHQPVGEEFTIASRARFEVVSPRGICIHDQQSEDSAKKMSDKNKGVRSSHEASLYSSIVALFSVPSGRSSTPPAITETGAAGAGLPRSLSYFSAHDFRWI